MAEPLDLPALRALCDKADVGPWLIERVPNADDDAVYIISTGQVGSDGEVYDRREIAAEGENNAAFIAAARTGWPAALDEIERLRDDLARVSAEMGIPPAIGPAPGELARLLAYGTQAIAEANAAAATIERLTRERDEALADVARVRDQARTDARVEAQAAAMREVIRLENSCASCGADLLPQSDDPPHCHDCTLDDVEVEDWEEAHCAALRAIEVRRGR